MSDIDDGVSCEEIFAAIAEGMRLSRLGSAATAEELEALRDRKLDLLTRIVHDPSSLAFDVYTDEEAREIARQEARALRLGLPSPWKRSTRVRAIQIGERT